ncbi:hypothetical protein [Lacrimispora sp.]|uniref:hypothetical protein n=1 Tax=Lacrimispora sp. TaxID=2719234 RepID=UPI0032E40205
MRKIMTSCIIFFVLFIAIGSRNYLTKNKSYDTGIIGQVVKEDKYFKIIKQADAEYYYIIYNNDKKVVKEGSHYGPSPEINYIDNGTIEILLQAGTNIFYCTYYDINNDRFSDQYESPIICEYEKIVYLDYNKNPFTLVVRNIYDTNDFLNEFILVDISSAVSPIIKAEFLDENTLNIVYMSGQEFKEKAVVLNLN